MRERDAAFAAILEERAERYGAAASETSAGAVVGTFVGCRASGTVFGFPVGLVAELAPLQRTTPLAGLRHVRGLTHLRGDVMALVDLCEALSGRPTEAGRWMLVLEGRSGRTAVPVEEFLGARVVGEPELLPPERAPELVRGVAGATRDLWLLLDEDVVRSVVDAGTAAPRG